MIVGDGIFTAEEKRRALEAVVGSGGFARSDQLKRFLRYICEMEIAGRGHEISEYTIGTEALGRPAGYAPGDDSSVRSRAYALRQKLAEYYETENPGAEIRIELRKGCYTPYFVARTERAEEIGPMPVARRERKWNWNWAVLAGALLALAAAALIARAPGSRVDAALREAWGPLLGAEANPVVCIATPAVMILKSYRDGTVPPQPHAMPVPEEVAAWYAGQRGGIGDRKVYMQTTVNDALLGDAMAAATAVRVLAGAGEAAAVLPEAGLRPLALRGRNVVLIGSPGYSKYAARILATMPFSVYYDAAKEQEVIADAAPERGPAREFVPRIDGAGQLQDAYGLLTVVPSQDGGARTVVMSGITSAGTQAAMEYFASAASVRDLKARFAREGYKTMPAAYQVVVHCGLDGTLALNWIYAAHAVARK